MSKTILFRLIVAFSLLAAAVLWLLSVIPATQEAVTFEHGSIGQWAGLIITMGVGTAFLLRGIFVKNSVPLLKKLQIFFGVALIVVGVLILVEIFTWGRDEYGNGGIPIMPIIAVGLAVAFLLGTIAVGGRSQFIGDNEKVNSQPSRPKTEWEKRKERDERDNKNN
jgi:hypothetical protein